MDTPVDSLIETLNIDTKLYTLHSASLKDIEATLEPPDIDQCIVVDFKNLDDKQTVLWFRKMRTLFRQYRYQVLGICNAGINLEHAKAANFNNLDSVIKTGHTASDKNPSENETQATGKESDKDQTSIKSPAVIYNGNIRSGQRIYHSEDIIVLGNINPGSEVISNGNIHVYGVLGGRALAGVNGNSSALIFAQQLSPELVSIDGHYQSSMEIKPIRKCCCVSLKDKSLTYTQI